MAREEKAKVKVQPGNKMQILEVDEHRIKQVKAIEYLKGRILEKEDGHKIKWCIKDIEALKVVIALDDDEFVSGERVRVDSPVYKGEVTLLEDYPRKTSLDFVRVRLPNGRDKVIRAVFLKKIVG